MKNRAFTMAEALLTMVILGVIGAIMIANLKPVKYRDEGFKTTAKKVYGELDDVINTILVSCTSGMNLTQVYNSCSVKSGAADKVHAFGSVTGDADLLKEYIRDIGDCNSALPTDYVSKFKFKNGTCVALKSGEIWIDVNDNQGPNSNNLDRYTLTVGSEGITTRPIE